MQDSDPYGDEITDPNQLAQMNQAGGGVPLPQPSAPPPAQAASPSAQQVPMTSVPPTSHSPQNLWDLGYGPEETDPFTIAGIPKGDIATREQTLADVNKPQTLFNAIGSDVSDIYGKAKALYQNPLAAEALLWNKINPQNFIQNLPENVLTRFQEAKGLYDNPLAAAALFSHGMDPRNITVPEVRRDLGIGIAAGGPYIRPLESLGAADALFPAVGTYGRTALDAAGNILKTGLSAGVGAKVMGADTTDAGRAGLTAGGWAAGLTPTSIALASRDPRIRMLGGLGAGTTAGYFFNQLTGGGGATSWGGLTEEAIAAMFGARFGMRGQTPYQMAAEDTVGRLTPQQLGTASNLIQDARTQGINMNLMEALRNQTGPGGPSGWATQVLHNLGMTTESAEEMLRRSLERGPEVERTVNEIRDQVSPPDSETQLRNPMYNWTYSSHVPLPEFQKMMRDPYLNNAITDTWSKPENWNIFHNPDSPGYTGTTLNDNQVLDETKKALDAQLAQKRATGTLTQADNRAIQTSINKITTAVDNASPKLAHDITSGNTTYRAGTPTYQVARDASEKQRARDTITTAGAMAHMSGSNLTDAWLTDDTQFANLRSHLGDRYNPDVTTDAQRRLDILRRVLPNLWEPMTADMIRRMGTPSWMQHMPESLTGFIPQMARNMMHTRYNNAMVDLISRDNWDAELEQINRMRNEPDRGLMLGQLLSRIAGTGAAIGYSQQGNQ